MERGYARCTGVLKLRQRELSHARAATAVRLKVLKPDNCHAHRRLVFLDGLLPCCLSLCFSVRASPTDMGQSKKQVVSCQPVKNRSPSDDLLGECVRAGWVSTTCLKAGKKAGCVSTTCIKARLATTCIKAGCVSTRPVKKQVVSTTCIKAGWESTTCIKAGRRTTTCLGTGWEAAN